MAHYNYYVIFEGRKPSIYSSWSATKAQVNDYRGNSYKGYKAFHEASEVYTLFCEGRHII